MAQHQMNLRRLRQSPHLRGMLKESRVSRENLMQPLFVGESNPKPLEIPGLTGVYRDTPDSLLSQIESDLEAGVRSFLLFGVPEKRDSIGFDFTRDQISKIKKRFGSDLYLSVDVCLCSLTDHGHCGVLSAEGDHVDNGATVPLLAKAALEYAQAGADCVAPSDMMDGRIKAIRAALDGAGLDQTLLMSYSAKFHSKFYGPFRVAADSAPKSKIKDRATYQIDPSRFSDALACAKRDALEGADILMVKPGMPYLDVLYRLSSEIPEVPFAVYEVSGEYAALEFLAQQNLISLPEARLEAWTSFVRAGAKIIITYGARNAFRILV